MQKFVLLITFFSRSIMGERVRVKDSGPALQSWIDTLFISSEKKGFCRIQNKPAAR